MGIGLGLAAAPLNLGLVPSRVGVVQLIHHKVSRGIGGENRLMHGLCAGFEASHQQLTRMETGLGMLP